MLTPYQLISENQLLMNIETVVQEIYETGSLGLQKQLGLFSLINEFLIYRQQIIHIQNKLSYSKRIEAFIEAIAQVNNLFGMVNTQESISHFINIIQSHRQAIAKEDKYLIKQEIKNRESLTQYVTALTKHYFRLLFVRVDLSYTHENLNFVDCFVFKQHIDSLLSYIRNQDTCFQDLQGYAWALEQGMGKGYHCHLLLIYDGAKHQNDWYLANEVAKKWAYITQDQGCHFNCNTTDYKNPLAMKGTLGIGMIHREKPTEVQNAIRVANYLVQPEKHNQQMRVRFENMRTFGKGQYDVSWRRGIAR